MSLGFLTESALVPSKAKPIKVDSKSIVDLKAVVFQKEQERQERQRNLKEQLQSENGRPTTTTSFTKYARMKAKNVRKRSATALSKEEDRLGKPSNRGVEKRNRKDEDMKELDVNDDDDDAGLAKKSMAMLQKKAKLYEDMMAGKSSSGDTPECLVDFEAKRLTMDEKRSKRDVPHSAEPMDNFVEITDEFGRTRLVTIESDEYKEFLRTQNAITKRQQSAEIPAQDEATESKPVSGGFVVSQWEKRLTSDEKTYLQQVHAETKLAKSTTLDKKTRKQLRLERLRNQSQTAATSATASTATAIDNQSEREASVQATAFLNELSSLM